MPTEVLFGAYHGALERKGSADEFVFNTADEGTEDYSGVRFQQGRVLTDADFNGSSSKAGGEEKHHYTIDLSEATLSETHQDSGDAFLF